MPSGNPGILPAFSMGAASFADMPAHRLHATYRGHTPHPAAHSAPRHPDGYLLAMHSSWETCPSSLLSSPLEQAHLLPRSHLTERIGGQEPDSDHRQPLRPCSPAVTIDVARRMSCGPGRSIRQAFILTGRISALPTPATDREKP